MQRTINPDCRCALLFDLPACLQDSFNPELSDPPFDAEFDDSPIFAYMMEEVAETLEDDDVLNYVASLFDDPVKAATSAQGEVRSVLQAAQRYSEGADMEDIETLAETLSGSKIVKNTASQNGWAARKYAFVQKHRAPNLPARTRRG